MNITVNPQSTQLKKIWKISIKPQNLIIHSSIVMQLAGATFKFQHTYIQYIHTCVWSINQSIKSSFIGEENPLVFREENPF